MSKPGERNKFNEDHGKKQSSSKLVRVFFSSSSFYSLPHACFPQVGYTLDPPFRSHRGSLHSSSRASVIFRLFSKCCGAGEGSRQRCLITRAPRCLSLWLSFQVWRTAWTVIPCAARRRSGVTTGEVTS